MHGSLLTHTHTQTPIHMLSNNQQYRLKFSLTHLHAHTPFSSELSGNSLSIAPCPREAAKAAFPGQVQLMEKLSLTRA